MNRHALDLIPRTFTRPFFPFVFRNFDLFDEDFDSTPEKSSDSNISISEDKEHVYVEAQLPGLKTEDIEVTLDKGVLWIRGEKKEEEKDKNRKYYCRSSHSFSYRLGIPGEIDETVDPPAKFENGIMEITFSKAKKEGPKKITIR